MSFPREDFRKDYVPFVRPTDAAQASSKSAPTDSCSSLIALTWALARTFVRPHATVAWTRSPSWTARIVQLVKRLGIHLE